MASSRVMAAASSANADLARQSPLYSAGHMAELRAGDQPKGGLGSLNMEELLRSFYVDSPAGAGAAAGPADEISCYPGSPGGGEDGAGGGEMPLSGEGGYAVHGGEGRKTAEEVWKEISGDHGVGSGGEPAPGEAGMGGITLEAFLAKAGAVSEEEVGAAPGTVQQQQQVNAPMLGFAVDLALGDRFVQQQQLFQADGSHVRRGNGVEGGKKRAPQDPLDKAAQQKQRRMIKNRESAARSRERKQAYTADLEKLVTKLEEENATLVRQQEEQNKARLKQLMENLIPVHENRRPPHRLRRTCSTQW